MIRYIESFCKALGNYACYAFCLIDIAEEATDDTFDPLFSISEGIRRGYIQFNYEDYNDSNNCTVLDPEGFLHMLTRRRWVKIWQNAEYKPTKEDYVVEVWHKDGNCNRDGTKIYHFKRPDYNSLQHSESVDKGRIDSYRIFREVV